MIHYFSAKDGLHIEPNTFIMKEKKPMKHKFTARIGAILMASAITAGAAALPASAKTNNSRLSQYEAFTPATQTYWKYCEQYKFPAGKYWNGGNPDSYTSSPCTDHSSAGRCNQVSSGIRVREGYPSEYIGVVKFAQCVGFARQLAADFFGSQVWVRYDYRPGFQFRFGDQIRIGNGQHSVFVTEVNGNSLKIADCNAGGNCVIRWDVPAKIVNNQLYLSGELYAIDYTERPAMAGDINGDSYVTLEDVFGISAIASGTYNFSGKNADLIEDCADLNNDGKVDTTDVIRAYSQWRNYGNCGYLPNERFLTSIAYWE